MPVYHLNGKSYNIPDEVVAKFEKDNPNATVNYQANGKTYGIPVSKRDGFLQKYPDAVLEGQQTTKQKPIQQPQAPVEKPAPVAEQPQTQPTQPTTQQGGYKPTEQELMGMGMTIGNAQFAADKAEKGAKQMEQKEAEIPNMKVAGQGQAGLAYNKNLTRGPKTFNAETGQFEDTYTTTDGKSYTNIGEASNMQDFMDYQTDVLKFKENMEAMGLGDITGQSDKDINQRIKEAYEELDNLEVEINKASQKGLGIRFKNDPVLGVVEDSDNSGNQDLFNLRSAERLLKRRITALEAERDNPGFLRGSWDVLKDASNYSFGLTDLADSENMKGIKQKIDAANGGLPNLTDSEKLLARNYLMNQEAQALNENRSWWYSAGQGFGQTLSFMKDFAVTGGGFANIAKAGYRMGTEAGLKIAASDTAKFLTKNLGVTGKALAKTMQYGAKFGGLALGAEVSGLALANTAQFASTFANINNRNIGTLSVDDEGKLTFKDSEDLAKAILYEELKASGENASEMVGPAFDILPGLMGRVIRNKVGGEFLKKLTSNKFWRKGEKTLDWLGVQGMFGEGMEEEYGMLRTEILNKITGGEFDPNAESITDLDTQLNTWATVGLTSAVLRAPQMIASGYGAANYYGYKYNLNQSDKRLREILGDDERYDSIKAMLDGATNMNIGNTINSLVRNANLSDQEKEAVMYYAQDLINLRGYNIGSVLSASQVADIMPRVASYQVKADGKSFDELDEKGNVIAHHEYENSDEMKAGLYEAQQKRFDHDLNSDLSVMKARPDAQYDKLVHDFLIQSQTDMVPSEFEAILAKPSLERTDAEQQMVTQFAKILHNTVYDNTMLHEDQSAQDGSNAADAATIDMNNPNNQELQESNAAWLEAQGNKRIAFDADEDLKNEVLSMEEQGLSHQEIISRLETFSPQEQQTIIDYYNQKARYEAMVNKVSNKIDEEAHNQRERHTKKGTINGQADVRNVYTITDGTNKYFLVSGNITTDPATGQITGSDSGLIIGMDLDGSFVNIGDASGYIVEQPTMTLDQFEAGEKERLQQLWTGAIDPNGAMDQQQQQSGNLDNAGGEAGAENGTGVNEPSATAPAQPQQPAQIPVDEKTGVKMYEQGVPVDQAIEDLEKDGRDVVSWSDLAINEAQDELAKMKQPKTREELIKNEERTKELQNIIDYYNNVKARYNELHPVYADAKPYLDQLKQAQSKKKADEILNAALQAGVNPEEINPAHAQKVADIIEKEKEEKRKAEEITQRDLLLIQQYKGTPEGRAWLLDRKRVPSAEKRRKIAELIYGDKFDGDFSAWRDLRELISSWLGKGRTLDPDTFGQELGWDMGIGKDAAKVSTMFAARKENGGDGMLFNDFVHMVMEASEGRYDTEEIRNELISMFQGAQDKYDLTEYQLLSRIDEAEKQLQAEEQRLKDEAEQADEELEEEQPADTGQLPFAPSATPQPLGMSEEEALKTIASMKEHATKTQEVEINDDNWRDSLTTPIGIVKMGENQKTKLFVKGREQQYGMLLETLTNPDVVLEEMDSDDSVFHERPSSYIFIKTFIKPDGTKYVHFESVTVSQDGFEVSISSHIIRENQLKNKLKSDRLLYKATALDEPVNSSAEQPISEGDGLSSDGKDTENSDTMQENQPKSLSREEYLTSHPLTEEQIMADTEALEDEKLAAIDFLRGEDDSAISRFYYDSIYERAQKTSSSEKRQKKEENKPAKEKKEEKPQQPQPKWQYEFHYDKDSGRAWITRGDVSGLIPIGDGRFRIEGKNLAELRAILENPANNLGELLKEVEAQLHNAEVGEQLRNESNPINAIETAAQSFREEQKSQDKQDIDDALKEFNDFLDNAKGSNVLDKFMRKGLEGNDKAQASLLDAFTLTNEAQRMFLKDLLRLASKVGYAYIKSGVHDVQAWSKKMSDSIGAKLREVLGWDDAIVNEFVDEVWNQKYTVDGQRMRLSEHAERLKNGKGADTTVNVNKQENNETEKDLSLQKEISENEKEGRFKFVNGVSSQLAKAAEENGEKPFKSIVDLRKFAQVCGMDVDMEGRTDILLQELVEDALVKAARKITQAGWGDPLDRKMFEEICRLYELQPTISQRSSNRIKMQQYSTPLPMAFVADRFIAPKGIAEGTVLEPTAGNGMLVIGINPKQVHVNELDKTRLANLEGQKFKKVTSQDATQPFEGEEQYDAVVANPPFGSSEAKEYDGKMISGLEEQITLNALSKMKNDGKAVIIIGGNMEYAPNGAIKNQKAFFTYLYDHYNVKGVIDMDGKLYAKQGTTYPTRMIIIDGRRSEEELAQTKVYPPIKDNAPKKATTFDELFDIVEEISNDNRKTNGNEVLRSAPRELESHTVSKTGQTDKGRDNKQSRTDANQRDERERSGRQPKDVGGQTERGRQTVLGGSRQAVGDSSLQRENRPSDGVSGQRGGTETDRTVGSQPGRAGGSTSNSTNGVVGGAHSGELARRDLVEEKRELNSDKLPYRPHNGAFSLESVAPAAMVEAMDKTLAKIEKEYGNIDNFVTSELGYDTVDEMHNALAAEQVDSVAMAIWNMKNGEGMVIGDQTGVGKGRQMAALIRWAVRQGKKPIFVTKDADLFSDIYRDLVDIGSGELRPFIFNAGVTITDANGKVVHKSLPDTTQKKVLAMNELPDGYDFAILSYPQMNTGDAISQEEAGKTAKENGERVKKGKAVKAGKPTPKADFLRRISKDNYLLMDESQNAAGSGNTGAYFQSILKDARAVTFASATFAKRPDTMPLYAIRTAISKAKVKAGELISMIGKGGVTLQEIMSRAMTGAGQMVRRERDMSDVVTDWKTIDDPETAKKARRDYDNVMQAFNAIIDFQNNWIRPALERKSAEFAGMAGTVTERRGTKNAGVDNPPFVNRLYNFSKQLLLSLKVDAVVNEVVKEIEAGHKPVIALENTLESALDEYGVGETIDDPTLFGKLKKGLDATFRYTLKDEDGNESGGELQPNELGPEGEQAYNDLVELIQESTQGMFISPLDAITEKLEQKGVKVGEISGRKTRAVLNDNGKYEVRKREDTDRKKLARDFNRGELDCLIINKTGSTGISLHASKRFTDQRPRTMIMAQPLSDINDYMQMIGRIDRTGQVHRGYYINLGLPVPAETRFMMMLANKLKSLNANTTTSQENKDNEVDAPDLLNKYGDQVMIEYLRDNPDVYRKLGEFLKGKSEPGAQNVKAEQLDEYKPKEGDARQITGRVALLSVDEQDAFYDDVTRRYNELIKYLNDTGANDLKITVMPLNARTIAKGVSSEGTAPNSGNPFADNAYVEWVEMDILKKPMKAAEVGKTIEQLNPEVENDKELREHNMHRGFLDHQGSKTPGRIHQIYDTIESETEAKLQKENERYEAAKQRAEQDIAERTEAINKQEKRTQEQKEEAIKKYADEKRQAVEESHNNMVNKIEANRMRFEKALRMFDVGEPVLIPDDLTTDTFLGSVNGIFCGFKAKNENVTPSTTLAVFCTLDGRRKIEVKVSDNLTLARIDRMTQENWDAAHQVTLSNWDSQIPTSSRKKGYIMTGNILQAIADSKQGESFVGQLVTFTDDKGNVRDGILMPDKWEPSQLKGSTAPITARREEIKTVEPKKPITSSDGRVTLTHYGAHNQWGYYYLEVPKSKKQGGEFYLDKKLLDLVDGGDFFTASGKMRGRVPEANIDAVVDRLGEMGVTLPSDSQVELEAVESAKEDSDSPKRMITTHDPIEAINQAAESWRQQNDKSVVGRVAQEIKDFVESLPTRFGLNGGAPTYVINSMEDIEELKGKISDRAYREIKKLYAEPDAGAAYLPRFGICVVFGEKLEDVKEAESAWWHEQAHGFWQKTPDNVRKAYGAACFEWLRKYRPATYNHIKKEYKMADWYNEAASYLIGNVIETVGTEAFLNSNITGSNAEIINFATELRNYIKNGKGENNNQLRRVGEGEQGSTTKVHGSNQQRRERGDNVIRTETESELQEVTDPLEAIELSAKRWKRNRKERVEGVEKIDKDSAKQVYHKRINTANYVTTESYQDAMLGLKVGQDAIAKDKEIPDSQNAYQAANLAFGKVYNQQEQFTSIYKRPLEETVLKICNKMGWQTGDMDRYLFTKSGFERNRELFVRDWFKAERLKPVTLESLSVEEKEEYEKIAIRLEEQFEDGDITEEQKQKKLERAVKSVHKAYLDRQESKYVAMKKGNFDKLMNGDMTFKDYISELDSYIQLNFDSSYKPGKKDYSGFTAMFGDENGKYDEAEIMSKLMADEEKMGKELNNQLWKQVNLCSKLGLDKYRTSGMISEDTYNRISNMFNWYVPMRGFSENDAAQDHWQYMTAKDGANTVGELLKHAAGRESEAGFPLATLFSMTYKAINDAEQNMVKQKFYRLCQANPNDLVIMSDQWAVLDNTTGDWVVDYPNINDDMTPEQVEQATIDFMNRMNDLQREGKAQKIKNTAKFDYKVDKKRMKEHVIEVKLNGERKMMIVAGNPRIAQAINGQLNYKRGEGWFNDFIASAKQFQQSMSTSYNLTFLGRNMARDWTHFGAILAAREGMDYEKAAQKYYFEQLPHMVSLFKKYREGTLDESNEMERDFKDFMDNGGITGYVQMMKVEKLQKEIANMLTDQGKIKKVGKSFIDKTLGAVEAMNEAIENNARFAAYRASRHVASRTKSRSAYDAKEVTVNFNKKGAGRKTASFKSDDKRVMRAAKIAGETAQILMANKMFFNATLQAICNIFRGIRNKDGSINYSYLGKLLSVYAIPPFTMGLLMPVINSLLLSLAGGGDDGDDPYANLPEWVRRKNICFYTGWIPGCGKNDFLVFPIGQELAAFYSLGDMMAGYTYRENLKPIDKDFVDEITGFFNVFSPVDFETKVVDEHKFSPVSEFVGRICSPLAPWVAVGENISWTGKPIFRQDKYNGDELTPEYQMTLGNTNSAYISLSKWLNDISGGDDVKRGWAQVNPGAIQYLFENYMGGPGKFFMNTGSAVGDAYKAVFTEDDADFNMRKIEFVRAFWQQGDERTELYRTQAKYRKYQQEANEFRHDFNGYKEDAATNPDHYMKLLNMTQGYGYARMELVKEYDKVLKKLNTAANQAQGKDRKNIRALYNSNLQFAVEQLDKFQDVE